MNVYSNEELGTRNFLAITPYEKMICERDGLPLLVEGLGNTTEVHLYTETEILLIIHVPTVPIFYMTSERMVEMEAVDFVTTELCQITVHYTLELIAKET